MSRKTCSFAYDQELGSPEVTTVIHELNLYVRGWLNYYKLSSTYGEVKALSEWVRRRVRLYCWKQWKQPRTRRRNLLAMGISPDNVEAWHPLAGAPLRFRLRFIATLRLRLRAGSGLPSAGLFCLADSCGSLLGNQGIQQAVYVVAMAFRNPSLDGADFGNDLVNHLGLIVN